MHPAIKTLSALSVAFALAGCGTNEPPKPAKPEPARAIDGTFKASSLAHAKNLLMSSCSANNLSMKSDKNVITCEVKNPTRPRDRELTQAVNDEYATNIREVYEFTLTEQGSDVGVKANSFARYMAPVSVMSASQVRTRNLLDDASYDLLKKILNQAEVSY